MGGVLLPAGFPAGFRHPEGLHRLLSISTPFDFTSDARCTCPSDWWPCKHVRALAATWETNPKSSFDLEQFLKEFSKRAAKDLLQALAQMMLAHPDCLGSLGVQQFAVDSERDEESDDEW
jgi:uncharacterized Zn finger protein